MARKLSEEKSSTRAAVIAAMKALSNENRLAIFEQIRGGHGKGRVDQENRLTVCEVASGFDVALSTISHHLKELRGAGLITCERRGQSIL